MNIEYIKQDIIKDYSEWVELAMMGMKDTLGLRDVAIENFKNKLENIIKIIENE